MDTSSNHVPVYGSALEEEQKTFLGMLEESSTPLDKAAGALYFRCHFGREEPRNELHPAQYPRLISALLRIVENDSISNETRVDAAWALENMAEYSEEATHIIVDQGGIEALRNGLIFGTEDFFSRCIAALYNIAICCADCKRKCRQAGLITTIAHILPERSQDESMELEFLLECALELIHDGLLDGTVPILTIMLLTTSSTELAKHYIEWTDIASYCLNILAFIAEDTETGTRTDIVLREPGLLDLIFEILDSPRSQLHYGALGVLGSITSANNEHREVVISHPRVGDILRRSLSKESPVAVRSVATWMCRNIAGGQPEHVDFLFKDPVVFVLLLEGAESSEEEIEINQECKQTIVNLLLHASRDKITLMIGSGVFLLFPNLLSTSDLELTRRALEAMHTLLREYPEHANYIYHTKMLDLVKASLLENDVDLQELKNEIQTFLNARATPILPPCNIKFAD